MSAHAKTVAARSRPSELPLPYRGTFGAQRPTALAGLALPPASMPSRHGLRPLKAWRYVGVFGPQLMLCLAIVRIGIARQAFWAVWDRDSGRLYQRTTLGRDTIRLDRGRARVRDRRFELDLMLEETGASRPCAQAGVATLGLANRGASAPAARSSSGGRGAPSMRGR